jgi:DNA-binding MarR family transcriptional regulator
MTDESAAGFDTSLLFDVFALNQAVGRLLAETMRDGPLTPSEYAVYSAIFELEAASPTQLAARLGMRLTTFVDHLRAIEQRGHARRLPHPTDRRSYRVVLNAAGLEAHRAANAKFERAHAAFEAELGREAAAAKSALQGVRSAANRATVALMGGSAMDPAMNAVPALPLSRRRSVGRGG